MTRLASLLHSPELLLVLIGAGVFVYCSRHASYSDSDVSALSHLMWLLPLVMAAAVYATLGLPGNRTWFWVARATLALTVALLVCGWRVVSGFGAPGSGPKGQDAGLVLMLSLGLGLAAVGNAIATTLILRERRPAWDVWFEAHPLLGVLLTGAGAVPVFFVQLLGAGVLGGALSFFHTLLRR